MTEEQEVYEVEQSEPKAVQVIEQTSPMAVGPSFLKNGGTIADLKEMMALQKEYDAYEAKKAFIKAMAKFKETPIIIGKDKENVR